MNLRPIILCALCLLCGWTTLHAESLRFFGWPAEVYQGDAVVFTYRDDNPDAGAIHLSQIAGWRWDFNNDGVWDEEMTVGDSDPNTGLAITAQKINTTWYAALDSRAVNGIQPISPRLQVRKIGDPAFDSGGFTPADKTGVTENVIGPAGVAPDPDPQITVKSRSVGNQDISVNFSANPRLAQLGETVRFYSTIKTAETRTLTSSSYLWHFTNLSGGASPVDQTAANPQVTGFAEASYDVSLTVSYTVTYTNAQGNTATSTGSLTETKKDFLKVVSISASLQKGRAYRRGFPATMTWDDIIQSYSALGVGNNRYVYFNHFEDAFFSLQGQMVQPMDRTPTRKKQMAEIINELLQGQSLIANQRLVEALRIKYPRLAVTVNPDEDRLNPPAGARSETAAIDQALLDYQLPLYYLGTALQLYGADILRLKAPEGAEPYPQFPQYIIFTDPSLSQAPIPIKNEYWQFSSLFERMGLGRVEKAKKLYRLSSQDSTALTEAKDEAKTAGLHSYLGMAVLAAGQSTQDYQTNEGNTLLANMKNARDLFERINAGLNPLGNDGSFIPNESFAATYQDAQEAVADAREAEINARQENRLWESYQAELRNEQLGQRNSYITPLKNLTSIDPALYNDLRTADDQRDYRAAVQGRLEALTKDYPNANAAIAGELGSNVISVLDAAKGVQAAITDVENLYRRVDLAKWGNTQVGQITITAQSSFLAADLMAAIADGLFNTVIGVGGTNAQLTAAGVILKSSSITLTRLTQTLETLAIANVQLEKEIRGMLLEVTNLGIAVERANNQLNQSQLALDNQLSRMDRLIEDLAHTRETAADLYFQDPSFKVVVSQAMRRAESEMDYAVDRLYRLAKTLEYEWTEGFQNPVQIPVNSQEPASLENPLFDKFIKTDSLFFIRSADEAKDYLDALKAWDSKLRRINVTSVRGPNHSAVISAEPISMRETLLNLRPDATRGYTLDNSIRDFRNYLESKRKASYYNTANPSLEVPFSTTIEDNRFFPATGSRWNMRVNSIAVDVYAESGFSNKQVAEIDLIQSGIVSLRRYWASPPLADDVTRLTFNVDDINRTAFSVAFPAKINGATGGRPLTEFENLGLADRPVAATNWILRMNTDNPTNQQIDFSKIKDIVIRYTYTYGNPPEFPNF